jgi:hypothetical protein
MKGGVSSFTVGSIGVIVPFLWVILYFLYLALENWNPC